MKKTLATKLRARAAKKGKGLGKTRVLAEFSGSCVASQRAQHLQLPRRVAAHAQCCRRNMCVATLSHISL